MSGDRGVSRRAVVRGAAGAALAGGAVGGASAQEGTGTPGGETRPDWGGWLVHQGEDVDGGFLDARGQSEVTVDVGATGNGGGFAFAPAGLWIDPGTTVRFRWTGQGGSHNVVAEEGPAALDSGQPVANAGVNYEFTFENTGITTYFCVPHRSLGMKGAVAVGDDVPTVQIQQGGGGGAEDTGFTFPGGGIGAAFMGVVYGTLGLAAVLVLGAEWYSGVRERGGIRGPAPETPGTPVEEAPATEPATELGHDDYDPRGTAALVVAYFLVLVVMWVFTYFVEFLGNGPTVIG